MYMCVRYDRVFSWITSFLSISYFSSKVLLQQIDIRWIVAKYDIKKFDGMNDFNKWWVPVKTFHVQQGVLKAVLRVGKFLRSH